MRVSLILSLLLLAALVLTGVAPGVVPTAQSATATPTLVGIRAAHHPGFDRIVFVFRGGVPATRRVRYVDRLIQDGSGEVMPIAGRAILQVTLSPAQAHNAAGGPTAAARRVFALPNIITARRAGDFEAVTTYGIGLAKRTPIHVFTLRNPSRVVIDIRAAFGTTTRRVYFLNADNFVANRRPFFSPRLRPVRADAPAAGALDRLFAGPLPGERADGLRLLGSGATGFSHLSIGNGIARLRLVGGCNSHGSTVSIAGEIMPTLRQLDSVRWVKIFDPRGGTENPTGNTDSIPACLEP